MQKHGRWNLI
uniref:Uncharacterized protein n=1 Tax=Anguilla anguilla TaxID=7936 RepID=A0A0E9PB92_ANGAN